jgi:hypothetical protein
MKAVVLYESVYGNTDVLVSGDASRVAVLLLNGRAADQAESDARSVEAAEAMAGAHGSVDGGGASR